MDIIRNICDEKIPEEETEGNSDDNEKTFFSLVADKLVNYIKNFLTNYPLIKQSNGLRQCFIKNQTEEITIDSCITTVDELIEFVGEFVNAKYHDLFHKILMHQKITISQFKEQVHQISEIANELNEKLRNVKINNSNSVSDIQVIVFVDEFNTTSIMGTIKEVFVDHTLDGEPLPSNLFWVAAMNPSSDKVNIDPEYNSQQIEQNNFTGVASDQQVFAVRSIPSSLEELVLDFKGLRPEQEKYFLQVLLDIRSDLCTEYERIQLHSAIVDGQNYVRNAKIHKVRVSIRDIMRVIDLYNYFRYTEAGKELLGPHDPHWKSLIISIAMGYYLRLTNSDTSKYNRKHFAITMDDLLKE